ncbi:MAG: TRAP transporter small permease [Betaproteobacteria bacterium]|jgi:C4-dicarboxylate transporter DctQ subunit|nr:TRAP transporter small permease [Betaproteobacteria bacterium]
MMRLIERLEEALIALLLTVMTLITFSQVVARYVFNYSFVWALELNTFLFAWLIFLGAAYGVREGAHIGVDALVKSLSPAKARVTAIAATLLCMVYAVLVIVGGWIYVSKMYQVGIMAEDIPIPQWVPRLVLPIGGALLFLRFGQLLVRLIRGKEVHLLGDEAQEAIRQQLDETGAPPEGRA